MNPELSPHFPHITPLFVHSCIHLNNISLNICTIIQFTVVFRRGWECIASWTIRSSLTVAWQSFIYLLLQVPTHSRVRTFELDLHSGSTLKMKKVCTPETLTKVRTSIQCKDPRTELTSTVKSPYKPKIKSDKFHLTIHISLPMIPCKILIFYTSYCYIPGINSRKVTFSCEPDSDRVEDNKRKRDWFSKCIYNLWWLKCLEDRH
jgi:hypothetical protein